MFIHNYTVLHILLFYTDMMTDFHWNKAKKKFFYEKKKFKMADSKKPHFPAPPILNIFS